MSASPDQLQLVSNVLIEVARTLAIIAVAERLADATEHERVFLAQSLSMLINNFQQGHSLGRNPHMHYEDESMFL